jgi:hypothetical protein
MPRILTAVAEWLACLVYVVQRPRFRWPGLAALAAAAAGLQSTIQWVAGELPLALWVPGMVAAVGVMYAFVVAAARFSAKPAGYVTARAFVLAEFVAALHWQVHCFLFLDWGGPPWVEALFGVMIYGGAFALVWRVEARLVRDGRPFAATGRDLSAAAAIAVVTFAMSNLSFAWSGTPFSSRLGPEVFYIRTLVDLCGMVALFAQYEQRLGQEAKEEAVAIEALIRSQQERYLATERSINAVQGTYHDLKHNIQVIRAETDPALRDSHLAELESAIKEYGALVHTGNSVLDIVLTSKSLECVEAQIDLTVVADGQVIGFLSPAAIATLLGNALDNAIAATRRLADPDARLIKVAVFRQADFVVVTVENSFTGELKLEEGAIVTLHEDRDRHGYGMRSIRYVAERYDGSMTVHAEDDWFALRLMLPIPVSE